MRRFTHPLAVLRLVLGMTQPAFGKAVGVSHSLIEAVEAGNRQMSEALADAIRMRFGVGVSQITGKITEEGVESLPDRMFALAFAVEDWKRRAQIMNDDALTMFDDKLALQVRGVIDAAVERGKGAVVMQRLDFWIDSMIAEFGLTETFKRKHQREPYIYRRPDRPGRFYIEASDNAQAAFDSPPESPTARSLQTKDGFYMELPSSLMKPRVREYFEKQIGESLKGKTLSRMVKSRREEGKRPRRKAA